MTENLMAWKKTFLSASLDPKFKATGSGWHTHSGGFMAVDKELLDILACPKCKGAVKLSAGKDGLVCEKCRIMYPIKDDIPVMLIDEATPVK